MKTSIAAKVQAIQELMRSEIISYEDAMDLLLSYKSVPKEVLESPLWKVLNEEEK